MSPLVCVTTGAAGTTTGTEGTAATTTATATTATTTGATTIKAAAATTATATDVEGGDARWTLGQRTIAQRRPHRSTGGALLTTAYISALGHGRQSATCPPHGQFTSLYCKDDSSAPSLLNTTRS